MIMMNDDAEDDHDSKSDDDDDDYDADDLDFDDDDDDDDDDEIDRRGDGCPVLIDTVEERGEPVLLHLDIIISLVRILLNLLYILGEA